MTTRKESAFIMAKHYNPLEKEFLIKQYNSNMKIKLSDFCEVHGISASAFRNWIKAYDASGIEGLSRSEAGLRDILPKGIDRTEEGYKREILKLRIENERLKKNYAVQTNENGEQVYVRLKERNSK